MRRFGWLLLSSLLAIAVVGGTTQAAPAKRCPGGKVLRVANGTKACVSAKAYRQRPATTSAAAADLERSTRRPGALRLRNGKAVASVVPPVLTRSILRAYPGLERDLLAALRASRAGSPGAREQAVTITRSAISPVTVNADGSASVSGSVSASLGGPGNVVAEVGITASTTGALGVDVSVTFDGAGGARSNRGFAIRDLVGKPAQQCPTATGAIRFEDHFGGSSRSSENFDSTRVKLGTVREATSIDVRSQASARMGPDARLEPFPFSVKASLDYSRTAQVLAFLSSRSRVVASGTMSGTMDPRTGQISGASVSTTVRSSGFGGDAGAAEASFRGALEKTLNEEGGRVLKGLREVEARARSGACTTLVFDPASPGALRPKATTRVAARLETNEGGTRVPTVRWSAVAAKGSVTPATVKAPEPKLSVTGAASGPDTARITVKAVSPAGISTGVWVGTDEQFPASYSGTVSYSGSLGGGLFENWQGTFTYTRRSQSTNPDGSRQALYALTAASVGSHTGSGACTWSSGPGGTIKAGDVEIQVNAAGDWRSALLVDVEMPEVTFSCPPAPATTGKPKAFLNSRTVTAGLRPMESAGSITGTNVTDTQATVFQPSTATWNLAPGS
jgi:hypothetical protein